jgi:DNA-binding NarL/FixJ family response regulator
VLAAATHGLGEQGIARELAISPRTVNKHLEHAYRKLNVTNRAHAIAAAFGPTRTDNPATHLV